MAERIAVVTGTSTGFGHLIARGLRADGFAVFATMRDGAGRNAGPRAELERDGVVVVDMDVTDQGSVDAAAAKILAAGHVDVLVNNAGTAHMGVTEAFTPASIERQFATNVVGPARVTRAFLPGMREARNGHVIFVSSVVGRFVMPFIGVYAGSKFALEAYAESLSYELRPSGVEITLVEPGAYATNIFNVMIPPDDEARLAANADLAKMWQAMGESMGSSSGDPVEVSDAIRALVRTPAGSRPLRVAVPNDGPAVAINDAVAPIQRGVLEAYGLSALLPEVPAHA